MPDQGFEIVILDDEAEAAGDPVRARLDQYPQMLYTQGNLQTLANSPCIKGHFKAAVENALVVVRQINTEKGYASGTPDVTPER